MVSYSEVLVNNASLPDLTAVFVGATQGIGLGAVRALAKRAAKPTIFLFGRSQKRLDEISEDVKRINAIAAVHTIQTGDLALLGNVKKALEEFEGGM
jgi:short-subunit dehydrogenase